MEVAIVGPLCARDFDLIDPPGATADASPATWFERLTAAVSRSGIKIAYLYDSIKFPFCLGQVPLWCFQALNRELLPVSDRHRCCRTLFISSLRRHLP